jgi:hypothetical protein
MLVMVMVKAVVVEAPVEITVAARLALHYITDTLMVASQPTDAPEPTFIDTGRDAWHDRDRDRGFTSVDGKNANASTSQQSRASIPDGERGPGDMVTYCSCIVLMMRNEK